MTDEPKQVHINECLEALLFRGDDAADTLEAAQMHEDSGWHIATLPEMMRIFVDSSSLDKLEVDYITTTSEEHMLTDKDGNTKALIIHGGGILTPERIRQDLYGSYTPKIPVPRLAMEMRLKLKEDMQIQIPEIYAAECMRVRPTPFESMMLFKGRLPDGVRIPIIDYNDLRRFVGRMPERYGIVVSGQDAYMVDAHHPEGEDIRGDTLSLDPLFVARCGSRELALASLFKAREKAGGTAALDQSYAMSMRPEEHERESSCLLTFTHDSELHIMRYGLDMNCSVLKLPDRGYESFDISARKRKDA